jgi:integrase
MTNDTEPDQVRPARRHPAKVSQKRRTRRVAGTGAVIQRGDGRWVGRLKQPDGTVRWVSGPNQKAVEEKLADALRLVGAGVPLADVKLTVGGWLREWLDNLQGLKPSSAYYYRNYIEAYVLRSDLAQKPLARLEPGDLERLYRRMTTPKSDGGLGLSSTTAHHLHALVHRALAKAVRQGKVAQNVSELVDPNDRPKLDHHEMHTLADDDFDRFQTAIRGDRLEALFVLAIREGLRQGEILALHWRDVDLDDGTIAVTGSRPQVGGPDRSISTPKSRGSRRRLALFPETVDALRDHRARQLQERLLVGSMWKDGDLVFCTEFGGFLSPQVLRDRLKAILNRAGLPTVRFHDLRHSAATNWLKGDMHPKVASERLGHASVAITLDLYSHVTLGMHRDAVDAITRKRSAKREGA